MFYLDIEDEWLIKRAMINYAMSTDQAVEGELGCAKKSWVIEELLIW